MILPRGKLPNAHGGGQSRFIVTLTWVDFITLQGFLLSCLCMYLATESKLSTAVACLFLAMLADAFDGVLARKYSMERPFGRYLDSFVDCFIYLIAPCVVYFQIGYNEWYSLIVLLIFILTGIIRLSVFNEVGNPSSSDKLYYLGMPVFWSVFVLAAYVGLLPFVQHLVADIVVSCVLLVYSYLMLRRGYFYKPKNKVVMLLVTLGLAGYFILRA